MENQLKTTIIQSDLVWENATENRAQFEAKIHDVVTASTPDIIILPEMFTTGFSMLPAPLAEKMDGPTVTWLLQMAKETNTAICGSLIIEEQGQYFNRFLFALPDGTYHQYDKRHLFTLAGEHKQYTGGKEKCIINYKGWRICPMICYDLRFPVWSRNTNDYDLLIYVANWPYQRIEAWSSLLKARAIENMSYTIGVNRVGTDPNENSYSGHSAAIDYLGNDLTAIPPFKAQITTVTLNKGFQQKARERFNFLNDRDDFMING